MQKYIDIAEKYGKLIGSNDLFKGIEPDEYCNVLSCLKANTKNFKKAQRIYDTSQKIDLAGIIISGSVMLSFINVDGSEHYINTFNESEMFGEAIACANSENLDMQVSALEPTKILFLSLPELFSERAKTCKYAAIVTQNLLRNIAYKNVFLNSKIELLAQKRIRSRISYYLKDKSVAGKDTISLPLNRQGLANYLGVDRSALSRELCAMRDEGIISFDKNKITIKKPENLI